MFMHQAVNKHKQSLHIHQTSQNKHNVEFMEYNEVYMADFKQRVCESTNTDDNQPYSLHK